MRPMMRLLLGLCALVAILAGVALALPGHVTVVRSVVINAPEAVVFSYLNNLRRFNYWSPWTARDPQMQVTYSGPEQGEGAKIQWTSDKRSVGQGSMEITSSSPNRHIDLAVDLNGLEGTSSYDVAPSGSGSKVTWGFGYESGTSPLKRWQGLMLDRFVGAEYSDGLSKLKDRIETERKPMVPSVSDVPPSAESVAPMQPVAPTPDAAATMEAPARDQPVPDPAQSQQAAQPAAPPAAPAPAPTRQRRRP